MSVSDNSERLSLLPCFPSKMNDEEKILLLPNVAGKSLLITMNRSISCVKLVLETMLSTSQLEYRKHGAFTCQFEYIENRKSRIPSFMKFIYRNLIVNMSEKLKVDESIIDFNLTRLDEVTIQSVLHRMKQTNSNDQLNFAYHLHEWPIALEIFLQIDGKVSF